MDEKLIFDLTWLKFTIIPILLTIVIIILLVVGHKLMDKLLDIKKDQIQLEREKIYINVDPELVHKTIDNMIKNKIDNYLIDHGVVDNDTQSYINNNMIKDMITDITKDIYIHLSDLYKSYILMLTKEVENEYTILKFIRDKVKYQVISIAVEINPPKE